MKRDPELIRSVLLFFEKKDSFEIVEAGSLNVEGYEDKAIEYHLMLMAQAGLVDCEAFRSKSNPERLIRVMPFNLTWKGHEYLDGVRDSSVWKKAVKSSKGKTGDFIFDVAFAIGRQTVRAAAKKVTGLDLDL